MKISLRIVLGITGAALALGLSSGTGHAQTQGQAVHNGGKASSAVQHRAPQHRQPIDRSPHHRHPRHPHHPPGVVVEVPPPLLSPNSLGLIEESYQIMRRTSPRPNEFYHGRWNPSYQVVPPATIVTPPVYAYPPYGYGYVPGYGYGVGGTNVNIGVGVVPAPASIPRAQTQAELDTLRDRAQALRNADTQQPSAPRSQAIPTDRATKPTTSTPSTGNFYLQKSAERETLPDALDDIRKAWLNGDTARLQARMKADGAVRVFVEGEFKQELATSDFSTLVRQAMAEIDTVSFEFDRPASEEEGRVFVSGVHTFLDGEKNKHNTHVSYVLEREGNRWLIVETGSGSEAIKGHR